MEQNEFKFLMRKLFTVTHKYMQIKSVTSVSPLRQRTAYARNI